ncbi:hypothetical protein SFC66_10745 [Terribacillus saccharophilus]|uniref:hypothetical protein n=1 Tax=Terribacillus saccharophilus TaxID=361277 RepID=UPI0039825D11
MADIVDLDQMKTKKRMYQVTRLKGIEYVIFLTVIKYVNKHTNNMLSGNAFQTTASNLADIYNGDRKLFLKTYHELLCYWDIALVDGENPINEEFERFPQIGDLCFFIDRKVQKDKYSC